MVVAVFLTSATVVLNHSAEGSQIQTCNFVREPPQKFCHKSTDTVCLIVLMMSLTQNIRCVTERLLRAACMFENHCSTSNTTPGSFDVIDLAMIKPKKHQRLADPLLQSDVVTIAFSVFSWMMGHLVTRVRLLRISWERKILDCWTGSEIGQIWIPLKICTCY